MASRAILCFGDSLTEGYFRWGTRFHPYSNRLIQLIEQKNSASGSISVISSGNSGESAFEMVKRLPKELGQKFDWVVILGGTNDLSSSDAQEIFDEVVKLHRLAYQNGANTVAVSLPEMGAEKSWPSIRETRISLNQKLSEFAKESQGKTLFVDLCSAIPFHSKTEEERKVHWDDSIHFTPAGYDLFGELVFQALSSHI